ncbi:hypothetical protein GCM10011571_32940 [Marinithermofilum abyssi]|uniref:Helix-turn-helix domain-containing protein n=1 Tax=Marinithermofilum abyssi TaxID=1571185 RepID=A0A8J2VJ64_9BACL|nr:helix-turn-helix domain-containing protein [Marinithermofilum abyssi]GGE28249.1 hypothetical protein GCM10011571_32940 [Marinithermofilum abyssi]
MNEEQMKAIIGGIFGTGTYTEWDEDGNAIQKKEKFNIRLYRDLWDSGAIKKLKGNRLGVFLTIAIHADNDGEGWPSQKTIASKLGINPETVNTAVQHLEKDGFIERDIVFDENGRCVGTVYKLRFAPNLSEEKKKKRNPKIIRMGGEKSKKSNSENPNRKNRVGKSESENPNRKNRVGKSERKDDVSLKDDPDIKKDPGIKDDIKQQQQDNLTDYVVVVKGLIQGLFQQEYTDAAIKRLISLANENKKDIEQAIYKCVEVIMVKRELGEEPMNPYGIIDWELKFGWDLESLRAKAMKKQAHNYNVEHGSDVELYNWVKRG